MHGEVGIWGGLKERLQVGWGDVRRSCTQCVGTMSQPHTCLWYHSRGTSPEPVPALLAVALCSSQVLLQPPLLTQCGLSTPHQCCAPPKRGLLLHGDQELQPHTCRAPAELCGAGRNPQPTPWQASLAHPACQGILRDPGSIPVPPAPSAFLRPHTLPASCLPGASSRPESPRGLCR